MRRGSSTARRWSSTVRARHSLIHRTVEDRHAQAIHVRHRHREQLSHHRMAGQNHPPRSRCRNAATSSAGSEDFQLVKELGMEYLRYGPPLYKTHLGAGKLRLGLHRRNLRRAEAAGHHADRRPLPLRRARLGRRLSIIPIGRSCSPNTPGPSPSDIPGSDFYTPVNEIFVAATFSGLLGWWNERQTQRSRLRDRAAATSARPTCWRCARS